MRENSKLTLSNLFSVEDMVCVVTGGGTGIGLMITQAFANNGARVYITSRRQDALEQAAQRWGSSLSHPKGRIVPIACDVTSKESIQHLVMEVGKHESHVDVLVNNAGYAGDELNTDKGDFSAEELSQELFSQEMEEWEQVYRTNVASYFFVTAAFIPLLSASTRGEEGDKYRSTVINISSNAGLTRLAQKRFHYTASKAATIQLSNLLAHEFRRSAVQIRVNNIAPGLFPSEMTTGDSNQGNKSTIPTDSDRMKRNQVPAGRSGREEDIAQVAIMFAVNQYLFGQTLAIDGGWLLEHP
ncbi:NAD(P)-binding protein [Coniophora puteana RWD-64-598 SS2]|uniref:NAD(P)-binding protein n=1 Tax=Coniophora puteana (strain RWD-64-598) TaxID=741705 RepID=A0A5M3MGY4_CONPW|nr:NAD(P)-binding protein [Coniophora puteana RWD-64-598 SS2]EIW78034.1 NAD(P)-binding protein [Coniophora puteana RWD-64-598 SS2]